METRIEILNEVSKKLIAEFSSEEIKPYHNKILQDFKKVANIPGFRKGKAPVSMLEKRYADEIKSEIIKEISQNEYEDIVESQKNELGKVLYEEVVDFQMKPDKAVSLSIYYEVVPEADPGDMSELKLEIPKLEANLDEECEKTLEGLREKQAKFKPSDKEQAELSDYAEIAIKAKEVDGDNLMNNDNMDLELSETGIWSEVSSEVLQMKKGESKSFSIVFADEDTHGIFKGKKVAFDVTLNQVKTRELPEINDDFAKELGTFDTIDELKEDIKKNLEKKYDDMKRSSKQKAVIDELNKRIEFPAPEKMVQMEARKMVQDYINQLAQYGIKPDMDEKRIKEMFENYKDAAAQRVKTSIIVGIIADKQNFEVSENDIDAELEKFSQSVDGTTSKDMIRQMLEERGEMDNIKNYILQEKTFDYIIDTASFTEKEVEDNPEENA